MQKLRDFFESSGGRTFAVFGCIGAIALLAVIARTYFERSPAAALSADRAFICAESGKPFEHTIRVGDTLPVRSPHSNRETGYPAELCGWTADGQVARKPTLVLLNRYRGQPEPTFCPDCGRLVEPHNPAAEPDRQPPPTRAEYRPSARAQQ